MKIIFLLILSLVMGANSLSAQYTGIKYEKRIDWLNANDCKPSEFYLKKKIKAELAAAYTEYPDIAVDFKSFKGQNGYADKVKPGRFAYPYKIEMLVYLRRKITKEGKQLTEIVTWKYDAVYEYATIKGGNCEFYKLPSSQITRTNYQVF